MQNIFKRLLFLLIVASLGLQSMAVYSSHMREDLSEIWSIEQNEKTGDSELEIEKTDTETVNFETHWFHSLNSFQHVLAFALLPQNECSLNYLSPILPFLSPPPENMA